MTQIQGATTPHNSDEESLACLRGYSWWCKSLLKLRQNWLGFSSTIPDTAKSARVKITSTKHFFRLFLLLSLFEWVRPSIPLRRTLFSSGVAQAERRCTYEFFLFLESHREKGVQHSTSLPFPRQRTVKSRFVYTSKHFFPQRYLYVVSRSIQTGEGSPWWYLALTKTGRLEKRVKSSTTLWHLVNVSSHICPPSR